MRISSILIILLFGFLTHAQAQEFDTNTDTIPDNLYGGLSFRNLTPAFVSGRIADFAVNPNNHSEYYVAVASGHIWKTINNGTTFKAVFDNYKSWSIGCLAMDPNNSNVVWAGTGENNHQRAIGYGDGVYKTLDGGKSWKNMGLEKSMQIGMIQIDPRNSDVVYVAAEGSIWGPNEERGLYKTTDGGKSWNKIFEISVNTGVNNVVLSPDNPDIIYITTEQRRRRTQMRIGGGPESAVYKSTDAGENFRKLTNGIPGVDKGGMGIAVSPVDPNVVYVMVEAALGKDGFFRSTDRGESFNKMSSYSTSGQYYGEIYCDPIDVNTIYSTETVSKFSVDAGKTWQNIGNNHRHVDDHALWIDPNDTNHFIIGGDGGVYETFDRGSHFIHKTNLPLTQFYRVGVDNTEPFYFVYGGTQDNSSLGGPSSSLYRDGISRGEWVITLGGDGFWQAVDPNDPNIVYSEYQYGNVSRHDKQSGENTNIKPRERLGEESYKWNWNTPLILSNHQSTRLYMAANKVFKSDDRGASWEVISDDITTGLSRDTWPVMDQYWSVDALDKNVSTSLYGTAVSLAESPLDEQLIFVGTDDGLVHISQDMGASWSKINSFPNVPEFTYVSDILPSKYDKNVVFVTFDNIKHNDFKPYILKSEDLGISWSNISNDLPENGTVHTIEQDFVNADLLFAGTEFGVYFSANGGNQWIQLKSGIPTISVKDIAIQERECDLVLASFGRGFYILDNYAPLREIALATADENGYLFPVKDPIQFMSKSRGGYGFGSMPYYSANREYGAIFTYYLKDIPKTKNQLRKEKEKELFKNKERIPIPTPAELEEEKKEVKPYLEFSIYDEHSQLVRRINNNPSKGINRISWNLRFPSVNPVWGSENSFDPLARQSSAMPVMPGKYMVELKLIASDTVLSIGSRQPFVVKSLDNVTLPAENKEELLAFQKKAAEIGKVIRGASKQLDELEEKAYYIKKTVHQIPEENFALVKAIDKVIQEISDIKWLFNGEVPKASSEERIPAQVTINDRLGALETVSGRTSSGVTGTQREVYSILEKELPPVLERLDKLTNKDITEIEVMLDAIGAPWTPGRVPKWKKDQSN